MQSTSYRIPSHKVPGVYYRVTVFDDGMTACDCADATYRHRQCKHQRQVLGGFIPPQPIRPARTERPLEPGFRRVGRDIVMDAGFSFPAEV